jgi:hypothetical protein
VIAKIKDRGNGTTFFAEFDKVGYKPLAGNRNQKTKLMERNRGVNQVVSYMEALVIFASWIRV